MPTFDFSKIRHGQVKKHSAKPAVIIAPTAAPTAAPKEVITGGAYKVATPGPKSEGLRRKLEQIRVGAAPGEGQQARSKLQRFIDFKL